jgi:TonB family protein
MVRHTALPLALGVLFVVPLSVPVPAPCQSHELALTKVDEASLNALAFHAAQKIQEAHLEESEPKVLVIDFFRSSPGNSSQLGTALADRFSESLASYAAGFYVLDRPILKDYLLQNWTTLEDLQSSDVCLRIARQLGATGVIIGTLYEENGYLSLTTHLVGFGLIRRTPDTVEPSYERARFLLTEEFHAMLFASGPQYARKAEEIPEEPEIFKSGIEMPVCISCQPPDYSDAARAAGFSGKVILSIVVNTDGKIGSIYVLKGAPFGLTAKVIDAVQHWRFEPARNDHTPVPSRIPVETTFQIDAARHDDQ